jgi:hypothetical protein
LVLDRRLQYSRDVLFLAATLLAGTIFVTADIGTS